MSLGKSAYLGEAHVPEGLPLGRIQWLARYFFEISKSRSGDHFDVPATPGIASEWPYSTERVPSLFPEDSNPSEKIAFYAPLFTYSLRCECESNWRVTYETDPNLVDFWRGSWLPIMRHADHDGAIRLLRLGPVPEKKRDKVPWVLRSVNL